MQVFSIFNAITDSHRMPQPFNRAQAEARLADFMEAAEACGEAVLKSVSALQGETRGHSLLLAVFGNSPFLSRIAMRDPAFFAALAQEGPVQIMNRIHDATAHLAATGLPQPELAKQLRVLRGQAALCIALADIAGVWGLAEVTSALSDFARNILQAVTDAMLCTHAKAGDLTLNDPQHPSQGCGYVIIAMGKLGARELNYSSDIDLIVLFDPQRCAYHGKLDLADFQIRFTKSLVALLQDFTEDGYVFRVDLRLRPDPAATPIALSVEAAETYYESTGKGWERAAMIKARPVAGDIELGQAFLNNIGPFVWRKNLDYAAVRDVYDMVGLIRSHHGHASIQILGHNIKLGQGGIREIEFFAQTHQLIAGGRDRKLRDPTTLGILLILRENGQLDDATARQLQEAYVFLRTLEHRLQMIDDEQTQTMPKTPEALAHVAAFMGFDDVDAFSDELRAHLNNVADKFQQLLLHGEAPGGGQADQTVSIAPFQFAGFSAPERASAIIETWRTFRYRALRTRRAQELLTVLTPEILSAISRTSDPDGALLRFDDFLAAMPAGVQLLSLFNANPWLLALIAEIMGTAPGLAEILGRNPALLDAVLSADFLEAFPEADRLAADLDYALEPARDMQDVLDITRRWAGERKFQVGVQLLQNLVDGAAAGHALSDIADTLLRALLPHVEAGLADKHGTIPGANIAILAMGKLGARELTFTSDLDLVFVYSDTDAVSDGQTPLAAAHYFARLSQRLINALTAPTGEGRLYDVDMRLRPSGGKGPIAVSLAGFRKYHEETARVWEHMAWTRARIVSAPPPFANDIDAVMRQFLTRPRDAKHLAHEVAVMRVRVEHEFHSNDIWDFKYVRGGMMDVEFITQYLLLREAVAYAGLAKGGTAGALAELAGRHRLPQNTAEELVAALALLRDMQQVARLCLGGEGNMRNAPAALRKLMAAMAKTESFDVLEQRLTSYESNVYRIYREIILGDAGLDEEPALPA